VGGKGGVGKTTCAAILALESARHRRTLLVTTDPASSLSAVLQTTVGSEPAPVRGARRLHAADLDASRAFERWLAPRRPLLAAIALRGTYLDEEDVARLLKLSLPGIDEVIGLLEIARMARLCLPSLRSGFSGAGPRGRRSGTEAAPFEAVIVDTAPTGHTLRLLAAPALLGRVAGLLDHLQAHHRAVVSALRGSYGGDAADALIGELEREGASLSAMLRDPDASEMSWVTLPEPMALEETADALTALHGAGIPVRRLIVNRVTPPPVGACEWCEARVRFEARALAPVARRFAGLQMVALPELPREPRGVKALAGAGKLIEPWRAPESAPPIARRVRVSLDTRRAASAFRRKDLRGNARWLLFGGKGGVGKTTCAAAAALDFAADRRVLLVSTDPAHSLGDVFGATFGDAPRPVPGGPTTLQVREIDAAIEMARFRQKYVAAVDEAFARIARSAGGDRAAFRELIDLAPPGIDEVIAVAEVAEALTDARGAYDVIVTDTAPTGHALRLLQTPALLRDWTQALMAILLKYHEIVGAGTLAALLVQLSKRLRRLQEILADPTRARFVIVTRAACLPADENERLMASLSALGIAVGAVIVNATGAGRCPRCRAVAGAQATETARLRRSVLEAGGYAIIEAPAEVPPPHGAAALHDWRTSWRHVP
jgi:arsenite/tail-anchored protein-transporting ATPase